MLHLGASPYLHAIKGVTARSTINKRTGLSKDRKVSAHTVVTMPHTLASREGDQVCKLGTRKVTYKDVSRTCAAVAVNENYHIVT